MTLKIYIIFGVLFIINLISFIIMKIDKKRSKIEGKKRITEGLMFFMSSLFAGIGVILGMFVFHHKNRKWYFLLGIPFLIFQNIILILFFISKFK